MCSTSLIRLWFVCKPCNITLQNLKDFVEHKKEKHLQELLQNKCIVFEESILDAVAATGDAVEPDPSYETVHVLALKENTAKPELIIENAPFEQIPNSQLIVKRESPCNFNNPNDEPAAVQNILGLNSNSHDFEFQNLDLNQDINGDNNCSEDLKPNPDLLTSNHLEVKYQVSTYEIENSEIETQSKDIHQKESQNPYVHLKRLPQQKNLKATSGVVKVYTKYRRPRKMCSICSKSFASGTRLKGHFERVHKLPLPLPFPNKSCRPYHLECKVCKKKFNDSSHLRRHVGTLHKTCAPGVSETAI